MALATFLRVSTQENERVGTVAVVAFESLHYGRDRASPHARDLSGDTIGDGKTQRHARLEKSIQERAHYKCSRYRTWAVHKQMSTQTAPHTLQRRVLQMYREPIDFFFASHMCNFVGQR